MERIQQSLHEAREARSKLAKFPNRSAHKAKGADFLRDETADASASRSAHWRLLLVAIAVSALLIPALVWIWNASTLVHPIDLSAFEVDTRNSVSTLAQPLPEPTPDKLATGLAHLNSRLDRLTDALARLDDKVTRAFAEVQAMNAVSTADATQVEASTVDTTQQPQRTDTGMEPATMSARTPQTMPAEPNALPTGATPGPWVINLASLPDKVAADRFLADIQSQGIPVEQNPATVNGRQYWRMQVTGFDSAEDARSNADRIKDRLGLRDVWVSRR